MGICDACLGSLRYQQTCVYVCVCVQHRNSTVVGVSGYVLVVNVGASLHGQGKDITAAVLCVVALAHVGLSMAFKLYFFQT